MNDIEFEIVCWPDVSGKFYATIANGVTQRDFWCSGLYDTEAEAQAEAERVKQEFEAENAAHVRVFELHHNGLYGGVFSERRPYVNTFMYRK